MPSDTNRCQEMDFNENNHEDDSKIEKLFFGSLPKQSIEKLRINTFLKWPLITPNVQNMLTAGWVFTGMADRVICIYCGVICHKWVPSDQPYEIHRLKSPRCSFILSFEINAPKEVATAITITTTPKTQVSTEISTSIYALTHRRLDSFKTWPHTEQNPLPPVESFVSAGFYYTGWL